MSLTTYDGLKASIANWLNRDDLTNGTLNEPFLSLINDDFFYYANLWDSYLN